MGKLMCPTNTPLIFHTVIIGIKQSNLGFSIPTYGEFEGKYQNFKHFSFMYSLKSSSFCLIIFSILLNLSSEASKIEEGSVKIIVIGPNDSKTGSWIT